MSYCLDITEEDTGFSKFKSYIKGFCRCGCWQLTNLRRGKFNKYIKYHQFRGSNNVNYNGGWYVDGYGYTHIKKPDHPYATKTGWIRKHRWVVEQREGRILRSEESIHHIKPISKGGTDDIGNLMLFANEGEHRIYERTLDKSDRFCLLCGGKTYISKKGCEGWHRYQDGFICRKCYCREWRKNH